MPLPAFAPLLVGVADRPEQLLRCAQPDPARPPLDLVEARVDLFDEPVADRATWLDACARLEAAGLPVVVTIRLGSEGGRWTAPDHERKALFREALEAASWIDVEARSPIAADVVGAAHGRGRTAIVSHHNFARTPPLGELLAVADACRAVGGDVAKLATFVTSEADRAALFALLERQSGPTCVIGMGAGSEELR